MKKLFFLVLFAGLPATVFGMQTSNQRGGRCLDCEDVTTTALCCCCCAATAYGCYVAAPVACGAIGLPSEACGWAGLLCLAALCDPCKPARTRTKSY